MAGLPIAAFDELIWSAFREDLGVAGDITTNAIIPPASTCEAAIVAREAGRIAGAEIAARTFWLLDSSIRVEMQAPDGAAVTPGSVVLKISGPAGPVLTAERTALNFLGHLSGVATLTERYVRAIEGTKSTIVCTRKTTPGLRALEKHAVRMGGGQNHRFGLDQAVLIKDNHIAVAGGVRAAVGHMVKVEVEVDSLEQLKEALEEQIDTVLLDNMSPHTLCEAVQLVSGRVTTEASGGVRLDTVRAIAETGVDLISVGAITASAPKLDLGMDISKL